MPSIDVTDEVMGADLCELENAYRLDPKVKSELDQFDAECKLRRELATARKQNKMTQMQIKEVTGLTQQVISRIESNTSISPSLKNLMIYADALGYELTFQPKDPLTVSEHRKPYNSAMHEASNDAEFIQRTTNAQNDFSTSDSRK